MVNNKKPYSHKYIKTLLESKVILNISFTLFVLNILVFLFFKDIQNLCLLLIGACITYLFNKNTIIVLTLPILFVAILIFLKGNSVNENFQEGSKPIELEIAEIKEEIKILNDKIEKEKKDHVKTTDEVINISTMK